MRKGGSKEIQANRFYSRSRGRSYKGFSITQIRQTSTQPNKQSLDRINKKKAPASPLQIGYSIRYTNEGHNEMVDLVDVNKNYPDSIKYIIEFLRGNEI